MLSDADIQNTTLLGARIVSITKGLQTLVVPFPDVLTNAVMALHSLTLISDRVLTLKSYYNLLHTLLLPDNEDRRSARIGKQTLTEDTFVVACAVLDVDIGRQGGVAYLRGESVDAEKERKVRRAPVDLTNEVELKKLAAALARPDEQRGVVERGQIESGYNHLVKLTAMYRNMHDAITWIKESEAQGINRRKLDVMNRYNITNFEYEKMMSIARKGNLIDFKHKKLTDDNNYRLSMTNHNKLTKRAEELGYKAERVLNNVVRDFFDLVEKRKRARTPR